MLGFHSLTVELHLLQSPLGNAESLFRCGKVEFQLNQIDFRKATLSRQLLQATDKISTDVYVIFAEFYLAFSLLNFCLLNRKLRSVSSLGSSKAFFLGVQIFGERPKLCIPAADLVRAQNKQLFAGFYRLTFIDSDPADYRLPGRLNRISPRCGN